MKIIYHEYSRILMKTEEMNEKMQKNQGGALPKLLISQLLNAKIVSEYDQEIPQSQTQTTLWHHEEEPLNHHETPGRQIKQIKQLSLPHQDDCNTRMDIKKRTTKDRTITDSQNGSNNKRKVNNKRTTTLERTGA